MGDSPTLPACKKADTFLVENAKVEIVYNKDEKAGNIADPDQVSLGSEKNIKQKKSSPKVNETTNLKKGMEPGRSTMVSSEPKNCHRIEDEDSVRVIDSATFNTSSIPYTNGTRTEKNSQTNSEASDNELILKVKHHPTTLSSTNSENLNRKFVYNDVKVFKTLDMDNSDFPVSSLNNKNTAVLSNNYNGPVDTAKNLTVLHLKTDIVDTDSDFNKPGNPNDWVPPLIVNNAEFDNSTPQNDSFDATSPHCNGKNLESVDANLLSLKESTEPYNDERFHELSLTPYQSDDDSSKVKNSEPKFINQDEIQRHDLKVSDQQALPSADPLSDTKQAAIPLQLNDLYEEANHPSKLGPNKVSIQKQKAVDINNVKNVPEENSISNDTNLNSSSRFVHRWKQVRHNYNLSKQKDADTTEKINDTTPELVGEKSELDTKPLNKDLENIAETNHSAKPKDVNTLDNTYDLTKEAILLPAENEAPAVIQADHTLFENLDNQALSKTPNHDKSKGKRHFFNTSIFRTSGRNGTLDFTITKSLAECMNNEHATGETNEATESNVSPIVNSMDERGYILPEPSSTTSRSYPNLTALRKRRPKSDAGLSGASELRSGFWHKHGKSDETRGNEIVSSLRHAQDDSVLPDHADDANNLVSTSNDETEDENRMKRNRTKRKKRNFLPRHMTIGPTLPILSIQNQNDAPTSNDEEGTDAEGRDPADHHEHTRRHTIFSMDYNSNSTSMAIRNALKKLKKKRHEKPEEENKEEQFGLINELCAGVPGSMVIPMSFLKDERNIKRIPILLQHLKASFTDVTRSLDEKNRKYQIELRYGSGSASLEWTIIRDYRDMMSLHSRFKVSAFQNISSGPKLQLPKFPSRHHIANKLMKDGEGELDHFNNRKHQRHSRTGSILSSLSLSSNPQSATNASITPNIHNPASRDTSLQNAPHLRTPLSTILDDPNERPSFQSDRTASTLSIGSRGSVPSFSFFRRIIPISSATGPSSANAVYNQLQVIDAEKERFFEALRQALENYFLALFSALRFRPEANRLFQFLELSNMSMQLAPESLYHGKEGYLILRSSAASMGLRVSHWKPNELSMMIDRHTSRWYLVRESYIVCVNDISGVNVTEVFMVDSYFKLSHGLNTGNAGTLTNIQSGVTPLKSSNSAAVDVDKVDSHQGFTFEVSNGERKMKLLTTSQRQLGLWIESINHMTDNTVWSRPHRFQSFAPVRQNVQARWFVDARDYFWTVSAALDMAKDVIYIHDWWLSPELYLRRPADGNQEWRIDRLLRRKAEQGVKIFVIVYRNVGQTVPIDSSWTKHSLLDLHRNIYLMRSPNQLLQNTYFWAHHEKLCLIDHTIAFVGGIDLCFGRWDTPEHVLVDDAAVTFRKPSEKNTLNPTQIWPGKDYSNPRQRDFFNLDKPYEDMYNRQEVPRMPWHDVHMMVTGQPARDLVRHFVQRWNYLLRQKRPSRFTPLLLPPSDLTPAQIKSLNLEGTCEVQLLRSSCSWSLGIKTPETSIQNAYLKAIESSNNFVYIENQFFISSTFYEGTEIENKIGDALVRRIIRAHRNKEQWKCVIVIPLMPGFESEVDDKSGLSVRMIMQLQYLTISRGPNSIFRRLVEQDINPEDYIQFFSLRKWGKIGPDKQLVSEQLYIHCKTMIVDDIVAIIGSANINERSMRGTRDSEVASIIRDTELIDSQMGGKKVKVGKFPHTLRMRLMREHVGIDIDQLEMIEQLVDSKVSKLVDIAKEQRISRELGMNIEDLKVAEAEVGNIHLNDYPIYETQTHPVKDSKDHDKSQGNSLNSINRVNSISSVNQTNNLGGPDQAHAPRVSGRSEFDNQRVELHSFNHLAGEENIGFRDKKPLSYDSRVQGNQVHKDDVDGFGFDHFRQREALEHATSALMTSVPPTGTESLRQLAQTYFEELVKGIQLEQVIEDLQNIKRKIYYYLETLEWRKEDQAFGETGEVASESFFPREAYADDNIFEFQEEGKIPGYRGSSNGRGSTPDDSQSPLSTQKFAPIDPYSFQDPICGEFYYDMWERVADQNTLLFRKVFHCQPDDEVSTWKQFIAFKELFSRFAKNQNQQLPRDEFEMNIPAQEMEGYVREDTIDEIGAKDNGLNTENNSGAIGLNIRDNPGGTESSTEGGIAIPSETSGTVQNPEAADRQARLKQVRLDREWYEEMMKRRHQNRRSSRKILMDDVYMPKVAEQILHGVRGNLVFFPTQWLAHEQEIGNWQHPIDHLPPIEIYD